MKYTDTQVTLSEIPDEIILAINISNCQYRCEGCHSPELQTDIGDYLSTSILDALIKDNKGISCICFMGGDAYPREINFYMSYIKDNYPNLKTALYSGRESLNKKINFHNLDYYKIGPYIKELGGLNSLKTNQILYKITHKSVDHCILENINYKFIKNEFKDKGKNDK